MKYTIITSVGTSMLTNYKGSFKESDKAIAGETLDNASVVSKKALEFQETDFRKTIQLTDNSVSGGYILRHWFKGIEKVDGKFEQTGEANILNIHASAEITSLVKIIADIRKRDPQADITVQLIATDTALSVLCALLVQAWFEQDAAKEKWPKVGVFFDRENDYIKDLRVDLPDEWKDEQRRYYDLGLQNLVDKLVGENGYLGTHKGAQVIFNFSGGYKSIIPILTIIAQLEGIPMQYIFEDSDYLVEVGALPIKWDWGVLELYHPLLDNSLLYSPDLYEASGLRNNELTFLQDNKVIHSAGNGFELTPIGNLMKTYLNKTSSAPGIFGVYVESKLFEHFTLQAQAASPVIIGPVKKSTTFSVGRDKGDIDLFFQEQKNGEELRGVVCEIKSVSNIRDNQKEHLKDQFRKYATCFFQIEELKQFQLHEIRLIIHKLPFQTRFLEAVENLLNELKSYVELELNQEFSIYTLDVKLNSKGVIDYQGFASEPLPIGALKLYSLHA